MASITSITVKNIDRTTASYSLSAYFENSDTVKEYFTDKATANVTLSDNAGLNGSISGLTAGTQTTIQISIYYIVENYVKTAEGYSVYDVAYSYTDDEGKIITSYLGISVDYYSALVNVSGLEELGYTAWAVYDGYVSPTYSWVVDPNEYSTSISIVIWTRPAEFSFGDYQTSPSWNVANGIPQTKINWPEFNSQAAAWKRWKNQSSSPTSVNAFSAGKLSATMLKNAYSTVGGTSSYSVGDKVSKAMFSGLETLINATPTTLPSKTV